MRRKRAWEVDTPTWTLYERGIDYKNRIGLYEKVRENFRYLQGDQWGDTQTEGLPSPVFNIIKTTLNYKISQMFDKSTKIKFQSNNRKDNDFVHLEEVASKLTDYAEELWEVLKMDRRMENLVFESGVTGNGIVHFHYNPKTEDVAMDEIDITNIYPGNPNCSNIEDQPYIIIAFRKLTEEVKREALQYKKEGHNRLSEYEIEGIGDDTDNQYEAGERARIEIDDLSKTTVLLKYEKINGIVYVSKCTRGCEIYKKTPTGLKRYPIAKFDWEPVKNSFFGVSDVEAIIPNQDYINTIAAMIMASTTFTSFPKMVYNEDYVENPDDRVGVAIGISGDRSLKDIIDYITPGNISNSAFQMFQQSMDITKDLMGANDAALGAVDPDQASGRAIIAVMEQTQVPLERTRRRYYDFIEDIALIWLDIWRSYTDESKSIIAQDEAGNKVVYYLNKAALEKMLPKIRIEVGTTNRWSMISVEETLQNLLQAQYITFDMFLEALPDDSVIPKQKLLGMIEKQKAQTPEVPVGQEDVPQEDYDVNAIADEMVNQSMPDVDALINGMSPEEQQMYMQNPQMLKELMSKQFD